MDAELTGGCHCGTVRFRVRARLEPDGRLAAVVCNCSICEKKGFVHLIVEKERFELLTGDGFLTEYRFNTGTARHLFCRICGIHSFYVPRSHPDGVDVNVRCLDGNVLDRCTLTPFDGQRWEDAIPTLLSVEER